METTLKQDEKCGWKTHKNSSIKSISSKENDGATKRIYLNYFLLKYSFEIKF